MREPEVVSLWDLLQPRGYRAPEHRTPVAFRIRFRLRFSRHAHSQLPF